MFFKPDNEKRCVSVLKCMYILYSQILLIKQLIYMVLIFVITPYKVSNHQEFSSSIVKMKC